MNVLFLSRWFPYPPDNGSRIRIFNLLRILGSEHRVTLLAFHDAADRVDAGRLAALGRYCDHVRTVPFRPFRPSSARALLGFAAPQPRLLVGTASPEMSATVRSEFARERFDLVVASQLAMVPYAAPLRGAPLLLEELELSLFRDASGRSWPGRIRARLTWLKLSAYLRRTLPRFAACTVVSEQERANVRAAVPNYDRLVVVPNAVDLGSYQEIEARPEPNTLVFSGALTYAANYDAVRYFLGEVLPLLRREVPDLVVRMTGSTQGVDLAGLPAHPGVQYLGYVPDVRPIVAGAWAAIAPLRLGGGTRLKILEAMALGTPVVATSKGAEGLDVVDGEHLLLADDPETFAAATLALLRSPNLRARVANGGRRLVAERYDWRVVGQEFARLVERLAGGGQATERSATIAWV